VKQNSDYKPSLMKKIIGKKMMYEKLGISSTTLWRMIQRGEFPAPIQISPRRVGWLEEDVDQWIEKRKLRGAV